MTRAQLERLIVMTYEEDKLAEIRALLQAELNAYDVPKCNAKPLGKLTAFAKKRAKDKVMPRIAGAWAEDGWTYCMSPYEVFRIKGEYKTGYDLSDDIDKQDMSFMDERKYAVKYEHPEPLRVATLKQELKIYKKAAEGQGHIMFDDVAIDKAKLIMALEICGEDADIYHTHKYGMVYFASQDGEREAVVMPIRLKD